jgi:transcriptional regulator with XRE-family HTH domain
VLQARVELGKKLRAMYRSLGWSRADCGKFFHTSERTLRNWEAGRNAIPYAAFKLLRIRSYLELPGSAWCGWSISRGKLCTPEGHLLDPNDARWWVSRSCSAAHCQPASRFSPVFSTTFTVRDQETC